VREVFVAVLFGLVILEVEEMAMREKQDGFLGIGKIVLFLVCVEKRYDVS